MIPSVDDVHAAYAFLALRHGYRRSLHVGGVTRALAMARDLAVAPSDEPAALFFSLTRFAKSLGEAPRVLPALLAKNHADAIGLRFNAPLDDLRELFVGIVSNQLTFEAVRQWFATRLSPASPPATGN